MVGASSSYNSQNGPENAIDKRLDSMWHSSGGDDNPWIAVRMSYNEVVLVDVTDRSDCCLDRYQKVEVRISSSNISSFDTAKSCGVQSHPGGTKHKYR